MPSTSMRWRPPSCWRSCPKQAWCKPCPRRGNLPHYIYAAQPPQAALIDRLAEEYANNLIGVSMLIHTTGMQTRF